MTLAAKVNLLRLHFAAAAAFMPIGDFSSFKRKRADSDQGSCLVQVDFNRSSLFSLG